MSLLLPPASSRWLDWRGTVVETGRSLSADEGRACNSRGVFRCTDPRPFQDNKPHNGVSRPRFYSAFGFCFPLIGNSDSPRHKQITLGETGTRREDVIKKNPETEKRPTVFSRGLDLIQPFVILIGKWASPYLSSHPCNMLDVKSRKWGLMMIVTRPAEESLWPGTVLNNGGYCERRHRCYSERHYEALFLYFISFTSFLVINWTPFQKGKVSHSWCLSSFSHTELLP